MKRHFNIALKKAVYRRLARQAKELNITVQMLIRYYVIPKWLEKTKSLIEKELVFAIAMLIVMFMALSVILNGA